MHIAASQEKAFLVREQASWGPGSLGLCFRLPGWEAAGNVLPAVFTYHAYSVMGQNVQEAVLGGKKYFAEKQLLLRVFDSKPMMVLMSMKCPCWK
jgi:hypothetical protein